MATFTCILKSGKVRVNVVWDGQKAIARFNKDGIFKTNDMKIIQKLQALGYETIEPTKPKPKKEKSTVIVSDEKKGKIRG